MMAFSISDGIIENKVYLFSLFSFLCSNFTNYLLFKILISIFPFAFVSIIKMSAYALGHSPSSPLIRVEPVQQRARTLTDLGGSFCIGQTSPSPNTPATYRMRSFPYRTFRQSRLDDIFYTNDYLHFAPQYRPYPLIDRFDRRDHQSMPYTYWTRGNLDCLYRSDQPDNYRRTYEPFRDDYSCKNWSAPRRLLLHGLI